MPGHVVSVNASEAHSFSKSPVPAIRLLEGLGVEGDAHCGATMKHRGRLPRDADEPNTRQVHLIHGELHDDLRERGFPVTPGDMGENIPTLGVDLLELPAGTLLRMGGSAVVELTGLRNPCKQLNGLHPGLMEATLDRKPDGELVRLAGVMGIVVSGGTIEADDAIEVLLPTGPHLPLRPV